MTSVNVTEERRVENPFVGLRPFDSEESHLFFGREEQSAALLQRLHRHGFVAVVGASGCGKSSLVRAGLIPKLKAGFLVEDRDRWLVALVRPGDAPLTNLAGVLATMLPASSSPSDLRAGLEADGHYAVIELLSRQLRETHGNLLLLVDQFEEIFRFRSRASTLGYGEETADFVSLLLALAAEERFPAYVVVTMRSDFLGDCDAFPGLPEVLNETLYLVPRLSRGQLRQAIEGPIRLHGGAIQPVLVDRILNDAGDERDRLPVLQHALLRTWRFWRQEGRGPIDTLHYVRAGTLGEALSNDAEECIEGMSARQLAHTEALFRALTDTDGSNRRVRRPAYLSEIQSIAGASREEILEIVERFRSGGRAFLMLYPEPLGRDALLDISHESLIRQWGRLRSWVDQERESRDHYLRLVDRAMQYSARKEELLRDPALSVALEWRARSHPSPAWAARYHQSFEEAMSFLDESAAERAREQRERLAKEKLERSARRMRIGLWSAILVVAALGGLVWLAFRQANRADSSRLALHALSHLDRELDLALLWSAEAYGLAPTFEAESSLLTVLARAPQLEKFLHSHQEPVQAVSFIPGSELLASASRDGSLVLWNLGTGDRTQWDGTGASELQALAVDRKGGILATSGSDGHILLWDLERTEILEDRPASDRSIPTVALSPDGKRLAWGGSEGSIVLWDLGRDQQEPLASGLAEVQSLVFDPTGRSLASGHEKGTVILWNLESRERIATLEDSPSSVQSLAFDPEGLVLASAHDNKTISIWNVKQRELMGILTGHQDAVRSVAFSSDGKRLVSGSNDGVLLLWDRAGFAEPEKARPAKLLAHGSKVQSVSFSADGKRLASGGSDHRVILWSPGESSLLEKRLSPGGPVGSLAFGPDATELLTLGQRGEIQRLNVETAELLDRMEEPEGDTIFVGGDGSRLVSTHTDGVLRIIDLETGEILFEAEAPGRVRSVAFGARHELVAAGMKENDAWRIAIWSSSRLARTLPAETDVTSLAFSPEGDVLAFASEGDVVLVDRGTAREMGRLSTGGVYTVKSIVFDHSGRRIATATANDLIWIWDVETRQPFGPPLTGHRVVESVAFSPDGKRLASGSADGSIWIWDVDPGSWQEKACRIANRDLPAEEWRAIHGSSFFAVQSCPGLRARNRGQASP